MTDGTLITTSGYPSIINTSEGIIKIAGGKINAKKVAVENQSVGEIEIIGGLINSTEDDTVLNSSSGIITINKEAILIAQNNAVQNSNTGTINVLGGRISSTGATGVYNASTGTIIIGIDDNKVSQVSPNIIGTTYGVYNANENGYIYFYDGKATGASLKSTYGTISIPENYKITKTANEDGTETATISIEGTNVSKAAVNDIYYSSIQEAVNACGTNGEMTILNSLVIDENVTINEGCNITINMNGKTITYRGEGTFITNNGTLQITGTGKIINQCGGITGGNGQTTIESSVNIE